MMKKMFLKKLCVIYIFLTLSVVCFATDLTLNNNVKLTGEIVSIDKKFIYLCYRNDLFIIERQIIATVDGKNLNSAMPDILQQRLRKINFNSYENKIEINQKNQYSLRLYTEILQYFPYINPKIAPFEQPPHPASLINDYIAVKPLRLVMLGWPDITYGHRFIKQKLELRITAAYLPEFEFGILSSMVLSGKSDLFSVTGSLRRYIKPSCTGFFGGLGISKARLTIHDADIIFELIDTNSDIIFNSIGVLCEAGLTGSAGKHGLITSSLAVLITQYEDEMIYIPSLNLSIGFGPSKKVK